MALVGGGGVALPEEKPLTVPTKCKVIASTSALALALVRQINAWLSEYYPCEGKIAPHESRMKVL